MQSWPFFISYKTGILIRMKNVVIHLILDNIRSRENVGSIFRTADGAGVSKIYLCGITPQPLLRQGFGGQPPQYDSKISKTALGAEKTVPYEYIRDTWRIVTKLKKEGIIVIALEQSPKSIDLFKFKAPANKSLALIVGNEVKGISSKILKYCDKIIELPMKGKKESLNVSVTAGVVLFQVCP